MKYAMALLAFAVLAAFLLILIWHVPEPDLVTLVCVVIAMAGFDFVRTLMQGK